MNDKNKSLLIVEDDEGLQSQLRWCFDQYNVVISSNREDAIAQLRRHTPGVVYWTWDYLLTQEVLLKDWLL